MHLERNYTLREIQREVRDWTKANFDTSIEYHPLLGLVEEVGELAHAVLKSEQGIRGTIEEHEAAAQDAIGDATIYLLDLANRQKRKIVEPSYEDGDDAIIDVFYLVANVGFAAEAFTDDEDIDLDSIAQSLSNVCSSYGWDYLEIVNTTWDKVKQRNWVKDPDNGGV